MVKQALSLQCACGQAVTFPEGEIKFYCKCGTAWEIGIEWFWYTNLTIPFTPILTKRKLNHYERYMRWRNGKGKRR